MQTAVTLALLALASLASQQQITIVSACCRTAKRTIQV
jgi:hypothetical protein